jgi:ABC-type uncharacterized transport system permease subunit
MAYAWVKVAERRKQIAALVTLHCNPTTGCDNRYFLVTSLANAMRENWNLSKFSKRIFHRVYASVYSTKFTPPGSQVRFICVLSLKN